MEEKQGGLQKPDKTFDDLGQTATTGNGNEEMCIKTMVKVCKDVVWMSEPPGDIEFCLFIFQLPQSKYGLQLLTN